MKKIALTIAIILGMVMVSFGQDPKAMGHQGGGLFGMGATPESKMGTRSEGATPLLPGNYGTTGDKPAAVPVGSGIAVLVGLGAAYLVAQRRKED